MATTDDDVAVIGKDDDGGGATVPLLFFVTRDEDSDVKPIRLFFGFFEDRVVVVEVTVVVVS